MYLGTKYITIDYRKRNSEISLKQRYNIVLYLFR